MATDGVMLIGRRGDELYLLQRGDQGIVVDVEEPVRFEPQPIDSILKQGYWEDEDHDAEVAKLLMLVPEKVEPDEGADDGPAAKEFISLTKSPATKIARAMVKAAHQQQVERVQRQAARKLAKYFQKSVRHITTRLFAESWEPDPEKAKSQAARLIKGAYDKDAQGDMLVDSASQPVADAFVEGAAAEMRLNAAARRRKAFDPDQPRNPDGTWGSGGASGGDDSNAAGSLPKTDTPAFKAWFGNSKVVDADGKPLVVYRGTAAKGDTAQGTDFTDDPVAAQEYAELAAIRQAVDENEELAMIIGEISDEEGAEDLTDLGGADRIRDIADANGIELPPAESAGHVEPAYVKIENPLDLRDYGSSIGSVDELWDDMHSKGLLDEAWSDLDEEAQYEIQEQYRDKAFYKFLDSEDIAGKAKAKGYDGIAFTDQSLDGKRTHDTWRVHGPNQIKSAHNVGTFDPNDPDITKSVKVTTATQAAARAEEEIDFPTEMPEWLEEAALDFISHTFEEDYWLRIPETTRDDIEYTLEQGIEDGLSIREIARRIQEDHGSEYSKSRATMVARTEVGAAMNSGHVEGIRRSFEGTGVEPAKEWLSVHSVTTRDEHSEADGQTVPVDDDFVVGGERCQFPGDARLSAAMRINCLCTVLSSLVGEGLSDDEYDGRSLDTEEEKRLGREMFEKYDPNQPRNPDGTWGTGGMAPDRGDGSGAEGTSPSDEEPKLLGEWKNAAHKTAAEIHGVTPPDSKVVTKKVYHITKRENAEKILEEGFKLSHVRPRWLNDYAVSLSVGQARAERYFTATDQTFNEEKYAVLEVTIKGRYTDENLPVGSAHSPQDYTSKITKLGWDGQDLNGVYYVHNPKSITSIKHVKAKTAKKDLEDDEEGTRAFNPNQPRDDHGRFASGGGGSASGEAEGESPAASDDGFPQDGKVTLAGLEKRFPKAGDTVDGRTVRDPDNVPNTGSISAEMDSYEILPGIREVQLSDFENHDENPHSYSATENERTRNLAAAIAESKEISPLIVVVDAERSPYILEGGHRYDALRILKAKSFPALVVVDTGAVEIQE